MYQHVVGFIGLVLRDFKVEPSDVLKFRVDTSEADFLFGPEIPAYLDRLVRESLTLRLERMEYRDYSQAPPPGYDHQKLVAAMSTRETWFVEQHETAKQAFMKYLNVSRG